MTARHRPPAALLSFFRLFGLFPFHVDSHSFPEFLVRLLHLINILVELILLYLCYYYARSMFDFSHAIGLIVDVLQIIAPILTHLVSLLECLYERRRMEALWRDLLQLNTTGGRVHLMVSTGSLRKFILDGCPLIRYLHSNRSLDLVPCEYNLVSQQGRWSIVLHELQSRVSPLYPARHPRG